MSVFLTTNLHRNISYSQVLRLLIFSFETIPSLILGLQMANNIDEQINPISSVSLENPTSEGDSKSRLAAPVGLSLQGRRVKKE